MQNKQCGCLHEQHTQLITQASLTALSSKLCQVMPIVKAKKLNLWTAEVSSIRKIIDVLSLLI